MLHNKSFVVPIGKTSSNVAFVCQRHYAQVLINELVLNNVNNMPSALQKQLKLKHSMHHF